MKELEFLTHLQSLLPRESVLHPFREKGWKRLLEMGLPTKADEAFRYVPLRDLYQSAIDCSDDALVEFEFDQAILPECKHSHLVFVDGKFSLSLSDISALPKQIVLQLLEEAMRSHASFLQQHLMRGLKEENDPFALLNLSLHEKGVFFYVPPKLHVEAPVQILYLFTGASVSCPRLHIVLGAQSRLNCVTTSYECSPDRARLFVPVIEAILEEEASLNLVDAVDCAAWGMQSVRAGLKKKARLHSQSFTFGGKAVRQSYRINLKGEEAEADLNGLWMLRENRTAHIHAIVEHEAPATRSMQLFKGVLSDASQSSFEGKILVRKEAQKTEAYQLNKNLLLSQGAVANSKPNLEVFADDVKASHGATVSQLDPDQLFYLSTRGIEAATAQHLLVSGFCHGMIASIPYASLLQKMLRQIERKGDIPFKTFAECPT